MQKSLLLFFTLTILITTTLPGFGQNDSDSLDQQNLNIPDEIIGRIPENQVAQFLLARQRVINQKNENELLEETYREIGVDKNVLSRIPENQLFEFLLERGYVRLQNNEHIYQEHDDGAPPPEELIKLLYTLIFIISGLILFNLILNSWRKGKDQDIIIAALEQQQEIPYSLFRKNKSQYYLNNAIVFMTLAIGTFLVATFHILPRPLAIVPLSISIGFFLIRYIHDSRDQ